MPVHHIMEGRERSTLAPVAGFGLSALRAHAQPVNRSTMLSVVAPLALIQDEGGADGDDSASPVATPPTEASACVSDGHPIGCVILHGKCQTGNVLWNRPAEVRKYNAFVESIKRFDMSTVPPSLGEQAGYGYNPPEEGATRGESLKACGIPNFNLICGTNMMVHAVVKATGLRVPTTKDVEDAVEEASAKALEAAKKKGCKGARGLTSLCETESEYTRSWSAGFAVDMRGGELASQLYGAWDSMASRRRRAGASDPGAAPIQGEGAAYYVCAAAQVTWECMESGDVPPWERNPPDPGPPDDDDGTPTPPDDPPPPRTPVFSGGGSGCTVEDDQGKCCYMNDAGKCVNYGCWGEGRICTPNANKDDCTCE